MPGHGGAHDSDTDKSYSHGFAPCEVFYGLEVLELPLCHSRKGDCVRISASTQSLTVMPVPDQVRDDGSGIQYGELLKIDWIPGQARNDDTELLAVSTVAAHAASWA
jgi:hypothetical protein